MIDRRFRSGIGAVAGFAATLLTVPAALAGGSMSLEDALAEIFVASPPLVAEVEAAVRRDGRAAAEIVCVAENRLGSAWRMLGGVRVVPIDCEIAGRTLHVDGKVTFRDGRGRVLTGFGPKTYRAAETVEQTDLRWTWK